MTTTASPVKLDARSASETLARTNAIVEWGRNKCKYFKCYDHVLSGSNGGKHQSYIVSRGKVDLLQQEIPFDWKL